MKVRVATCVPRQYWMQAEKLAWLDKALGENPCDLFVSSQEYLAFRAGELLEEVHHLPTLAPQVSASFWRGLTCSGICRVGFRTRSVLSVTAIGGKAEVLPKIRTSQ